MSPHKTYFPPLLFFCSTNMAEVTTITALYLLWEFEESRKPKRRRVWVHDILRRRSQLEQQELRLEDGRFQWYFWLTGAMFDDLLVRVGARISRQDTNYRRFISAMEHCGAFNAPSLCQCRWVKLNADWLSWLRVMCKKFNFLSSTRRCVGRVDALGAIFRCVALRYHIKFYTSHNLVSLAMPEGLTNTWNDHYPPLSRNVAQTSM
jgi:hypothetical protein